MQPAESNITTSYFKPDLGMLNEALAARQLEYDTKLDMFTKAKAKIDEVNALEGYDAKRRAEKAAEYDEEVNRITNLYGGDLTKADAEFRGFLDKIGKDFNKNGEMAAIGNRYNSAMTNFAELKKRREENKITEGQFRQWHSELKRTAEIGIGTDPVSYKSWGSIVATDAVDANKFLDEFTKSAKADFEGKWGGPQRIAGKLKWQKNEREWIDEDQIRQMGMQALKNAMDETGQLKADYLWHQELTGDKPTEQVYINAVNNATNGVKKIESQLQELQTLTGKELQEKINSYYPGLILEVNGKNDIKTQRALANLTGVLNQQLDQAYNILDNYSNADPDQMAKQLHQQQWTEKLLYKYVNPYAVTRSPEKFDEDIKIVDDVYIDHQLQLERMARQHAYTKEEISYKHAIENPPADHIRKPTKGFTVVAPGGTTVKSHEEYLKTIDAKGETSLDGLLSEALDLVPDGSGKKMLERIADFKRENKITYEQLAKATISDDGASLVMTNTEGKTVLIPIKAQDLSIDYSDPLAIKRTDKVVLEPGKVKQFIQGAIAETNNKNLERKRFQEATARAIDNANFNDSERKTLKQYQELNKDFEDNLDGLYDAYVLSIKAKNANSNRANQPLTKDQLRKSYYDNPNNFNSILDEAERYLNSTKIVADDYEIRTNLDGTTSKIKRQHKFTSNDLNKAKELVQNLRYTRDNIVAPVISSGAPRLLNRYNRQVNKELEHNAKKTISITASTRVFAGGDPNASQALIDRRQQMVTDYLNNNSELAKTYSYYVPNGDNLDRKTLEDIMIAKGATGYKVGKVLSSEQSIEGAPKWVVPVTFTTIDSNGKEVELPASKGSTMELYLPMDEEGLDASFVRSISSNPDLILDDAFRIGYDNQLEDYQFNRYSSRLGRAVRWGFTYQQDKDDPNSYDPSQHSGMYLYDDAGVKHIYNMEEGGEIFKNLAVLDQLHDDMDALGVPRGRQIVVNNGGTYYRMPQREYIETVFNSKDIEDPDIVMEKLIYNAGLNELQAMRLFEYQHDRRSLKTIKGPVETQTRMKKEFYFTK